MDNLKKTSLFPSYKKHGAKLVDYRISAVTQGRDALGEVFVKIQEGELQIQGRGVSTDILAASAKAYVDAINRLCWKKELQQGEKQQLGAS